MSIKQIRVRSNKVNYGDNKIYSLFSYHKNKVTETENSIEVTPETTDFLFKTDTVVPKTGLMLVGIGGNNGSTVVGGVLANKLGLTWKTREGLQKANFYGSLSQAVKIKLGDEKNKERFFGFNDFLPMINPCDLHISGWDICKDDLFAAMEKSKVLDYDLQRQLENHMRPLKPLPGVYYPDFIASNQKQRADNVLEGEKACLEHLEQIKKDIRDFKKQNSLDKVIVVWTANTERYCEVTKGVHDSEKNLLEAIKNGNEEVAPSQIFALAAIQEHCTYINGSPQNTLVQALVEAANSRKTFIAGNDFKSGQTKLKSVLVDFLVSSGLRPESIVSYNHLGNNDGKNLSSPRQFNSKKISKSRVADDIFESNKELCGKGPDHEVVIKYVPFVGDSKRAMDEYVSSIFLNGRHTLAMHNTCEDSLLAAPIILDLAIFAELFERVQYHCLGTSNTGEACEARGNILQGDPKTVSERVEKTYEFSNVDSVLSLLNFLVKAPQTLKNEPVVNALFRQKSCLENFFRALIGLQPETHMFLEHKCARPGKVLKN